MAKSSYRIVQQWMFILAVLLKYIIATSLDKSGKFQVERGYVLEGHVQYEVTVRSLSDCAAVCLSHGNCTSINYAHSDHCCEINRAAGPGMAIIPKVKWDHVILLEVVRIE